MENFQRECGVLLHPISLPSIYGIGDLGKSAYEFVRFLKTANQKLWQILPVNPPGMGESPYQCFSAFAGNPMLIDPKNLYNDGLLSKTDVVHTPEFNPQQIEYSRVKPFKEQLLRKAFSRFKVSKKETSKYEDFLHNNQIWIENFSLYMALKKHFNGLPWKEWEKSIAYRDKKALEFYKSQLREEINYNNFVQFKFFQQWGKLKHFANSNNIKIIGDLPIYVAYDSCDVWANPHLYKLDSNRNPRVVAGVPPDYFSKTGQLWGNPIYKWDEMENDDFKWWRERFKNAYKIADIIRIDHFRGFQAYWEVPAGEKTAVKGTWKKGPGEKFFSVIIKYLGKIPVIAEDLGFITKEVKKLKSKFNFPGMAVLQFIFEDNKKEGFSPYEIEKNTVVYTGTHDNDTILGWYKKHLANNTPTAKKVKKTLNLDSQKDENCVCWRFIELAYKTNARAVIIPLQDILCLDSWARMNLPGSIKGNWKWRYEQGSLTQNLAERLNNLSRSFER